MRDLVTNHVVINALRAVNGISCPPAGGSRGNLDYVRLQHDGRPLAMAVARPLTGARPHYVRLALRGGVDASQLPREVIDGLEITDLGEVIVKEQDIAQGVRLIEYLVRLRDAHVTPPTRSNRQARSARESSPPPARSAGREGPGSSVQARCTALVSAVSELCLDEQFLWTAIRCGTEDRFRDELAYLLDAKCADDVFVALGVAVGRGRRADIAELHDGRPSVVIELEHVWGADAIWGEGGHEAAVAAFPSASSPLHAVILYEGERARDAATELGVVLLEVVHFHTETDETFRRERGLGAYRRRQNSPSSPDETDSLLLSYLASLGEPHGPIMLADHAVDSKTGVSFSIHAMFAAVTSKEGQR